MASRFTKTPLIHVQRTLAAQSATKKAEAPQVQVSKLANGLTVASIAEGNGLASVGLSIKAGSRYEAYDNAGVAHAVRTAMGLSSSNFSGFGITRHIQQSGSSLNAFADRELVLYHSSCLPQYLDKVSDYMLDAIVSPQFRRWEVPHATDLLKLQVAEKDSAAVAVDAFHKAAYREGLGNSLICPEHMLGKHKLDVLEAFFQKTHTSERMLLIGMGIEHKYLEGLGNELKVHTGAGPSGATKYHGGHVHVDIMGPLAQVAIGAEVFNGQVSMKDQVAAALLQKILGNGQGVKYGQLGGKLPKALSADGLHAVNGTYFGYSDSVLVGAFISCDAASAGENVSKVAATLRSINVTDADFKAAKKALLVEMADMDKSYNLDFLGFMHHFQGGASALSEDHLEATTLADVQAVAKKLSNAKFSVGACGNCGTVPYSESL